MPKQKRLFPCGHRGMGQACRRCEQASFQSHLQSSLQQQRDEERRQWKQMFEQDPIDLRGLPKNVVLRAREIMTSLERGGHPSTYQGKHFHFDRDLIRISLPQNYRLLCRREGDRFLPQAVLTHEAYNSVASNTRR